MENTLDAAIEELIELKLENQRLREALLKFQNGNAPTICFCTIYIEDLHTKRCEFARKALEGK